MRLVAWECRLTQYVESGWIPASQLERVIRIAAIMRAACTDGQPCELEREVFMTYTTQ
jgi:hypothetical protein